MTGFVGDHAGNVVVKFTTEALARLIDTWNRARPFDETGERVITLSADEYEPGKVTLIAHTELRQAP